MAYREIENKIFVLLVTARSSLCIQAHSEKVWILSHSLKNTGVFDKTANAQADLRIYCSQVLLQILHCCGEVVFGARQKWINH